MFCVDGVHPIQSGHRVYTGFVAEAFRAMGNGQPVDHGPRLAKPFVADNWEDARQIELGPKYLAGTWKALDENDPSRQAVAKYHRHGVGQPEPRRQDPLHGSEGRGSDCSTSPARTQGS